MGRVMRVLLLVIVFLFLLVAVCGASAAPSNSGSRYAGVAELQRAEGEDMQEAPGLVEVLRMLAQGIGVGAVTAFLFEKFKWFQAMGTETKWWTILGISMGLPILAEVALQFVPVDVWALLEPYWMAIASGFLAWAGSQGVHLVQRVLVRQGS